MDLANVHGINVLELFTTWFHGSYAEKFFKKYGADAHMSLVILDNDGQARLSANWNTPLKYAIITLSLGDPKLAEGAVGTIKNVEGKLKFFCRTGLDSVEAETRPYLVRPGDFPYEGAGEHQYTFGGVSGLKKEEDWAEFQACVEQLNHLIGLVVKVAVAKAKRMRDAGPVGANVKYLRNVTVTMDELLPALAAAA